MSKLLSRFFGFFSSRHLVGVDKHGNRYFARNEVIDGIMKEKRMVIFKGEEDSKLLPVEWICWLNGQRKKPPTPEEMIELDARRELVRQNVARLKEAESSSLKQRVNTGNVGGPDLQSFIQQLKESSFDERGDGSDVVPEETKGNTDETRRPKSTSQQQKDIPEDELEPRSTEPTGSGASFRPGTWQPPS
ncbi:hypothetical protein H6P81_006929 [Aristolochia fimbriata]|uniref:NADH dehydrogenase [ubiquinone] 1 alpha subcomplex subunit 12 n=1 Tax=Aristolochia fimbriata TaxID=158543 RepID=A0AAV7EYN1_ARIFI|nr:hypothetical protein H6P81_006929 [Aristolochia fimbriata]